MTFDSQRGRTVLFGGAESVSVYDSDTWEFDGSAWQRVATSGPPAGGLGAMAFDSARGVSVLFGGGNASNTLPAVTWEWNGATWTSRATPHAPAPRVWTAMTYDSIRHMVILFGGGASGGKFNDTWEYDGTDWTQVQTPHPPPARHSLGLAFDPVRNRTVLFGGFGDNGRLNDTWEYDGTDWTQIAATNPPAIRFGQAMSYDAALGRTVMFGGDFVIPGRLGPNNETWLYDGAGWQQLVTNNSPSPRAYAALAYDSTRSSLVVFGGTPEDFPPTALSDTWKLSPAVIFSPAAVDFGVQPVLSTTTRSITLTNTGASPLGISSIAAGGDYVASDDCPRSPTTLAVSGTCTISVGFTPSTGDGSITGALTVTDGAAAQTVALSGSGQWGEVNPLQSSVDFGSAPINPTGPTATAVETITIPDFPTVITGVSTNYPFAVTGFDCPTGRVIDVGTTCHASIAFQPHEFGSYSGSLTIRAGQPNPSTVALAGIATALPLSIHVDVGQAAWGHAMSALVATNAAAGTVTFILDGRQAGPPVPLSTSGSASASIPLNDATVPAGAGSYPLVVTVHPTDGIHGDGSTSQTIAVAPAPEILTWTGTRLGAAGTAAQLAVSVSPPAGETQFYDFNDHPVWVRFDVTDGVGTVRTYYARVANSGPAGSGTAVVSGAAIATGAFGVRARLVAGSGSDAGNAYVSSEEMRTAYAGSPSRGGYMAGWGHPDAPSYAAFAFSPGSAPGGSLVLVLPTTVAGPDGEPRDGYIVVASTSVTSVGSHSKNATASGTATLKVYDAVTGAHIADQDQPTAFSVIVYPDGSVDVVTDFFTETLPAGSGINHL